MNVENNKIQDIIATKNIEYIKNCIKDESLELTSSEKMELIKSLNDNEYIKVCVKDDSLNLTEADKAFLIESTMDEYYMLECVYDYSIELKSCYRVEILIAVSRMQEFLNKSARKYEYIKNALENKHLRLTVNDRILLIESTENGEFIKEYIEKEEFGWSIENIRALVIATKDEDYIKEWRTQVYEINNILELSDDEVNTLKEKYIELTTLDSGNLYTKEEYVAVRNKIEEILVDVKNHIGDNEIDDKEILKFVFGYLADFIEYDEYAITPEGEKDGKLQLTCRNLYGGLINKKAVCMGYANILKIILDCLGIECKINTNDEGDDEVYNPGHAWNSVKINGEWIEVDLTSKELLI